MKNIIKILSIITIFGISFWGCQDMQAPSESSPNQESARLLKDVDEAKLYLDVLSISNERTIQIYKVSEEWSEGLATWTQRTTEAWTDEGGTFDNPPEVTYDVTSTGIKEIDISPLWENGVPPYGILIKVDNPSSPKDFIIFASREHATATPPRVEVLYDDGSSDIFPAIADTYLWDLKLTPKGSETGLYVGKVESREKRTLLNFHVDNEKKSCETAFGYYNKDLSKCFLEQGFNRWGWTTGPLGTGSYTLDVWAAAGQCGFNKGTKVGTVDVDYDGSKVLVTYNMMSGFTMDEVHFYVGDTMFPMVTRGKKTVPTVAPGQFTYKKDLDGASSHSFTIDELSGDGDIYIIAHAVVCGGF